MTAVPSQRLLQTEGADLPKPGLASIAFAVLVGLVLTAIAHNLVRTWERDILRSEFERRANNSASVLQSTIDRHVELLESLVGLYAASAHVERHEFRRFVQPKLTRNPEVQAYGWDPLVRHGERAAFESAVRREGLTEFQITELSDSGRRVQAGQRDEYVPVLYLEPLRGNEEALGFDIASDGTRRQALERARDSGQAATTGWVRLVQEHADQYGVLIVQPVYTSEPPFESVAWRREHLKGYVVGVFRVGEMIEAALRPSNPAGLDFWVYQSAGTEDPTLNYFHPSRSRKGGDAQPRFVHSDAHRSGRLERTLQLPGQQWAIVYKPAPAFYAAHSQHADLGVLLTGLVLTLLLGLYLLIMRRESAQTVSLNSRLENSNAELQREIFERQEVEEALRESESYNRMLFEESTIGLVLCDLDGRLIDVNTAYASIIGRTVHETLRLTYWEITPEKYAAEERARLDSLEKCGRYGPYEKEYIHKDGHLVPVRLAGRLLEKDGKQYIWSSVEDITDYKLIRDRIDHMAFHDALTDLPNREVLRDRLDHALNLAQRNRTLVGVMFLDIDRFKTINDSLGHSVGDELLIQMADRLKHNIRDADTVARFGGDEFIVIAEGITDRHQLEILASGIIERTREPFHIGSRKVFATLSIGVALGSGDSADADSLIAQADIAMYHAKESGRNNLQFHSPQMGERVSMLSAVESDLRGALERGELLFHLQPILDLDTRQPVGMEILMRWQHPLRGLGNPADFISVMEDSGMIVPTSRWVLEQACRFLGTARRETKREISVSVNFSAHCFLDPGIANFVKQSLVDSGVQPHELIIEITESTLFRDPKRVHPVLKSLKAMGVRIALDDFGTGQSSLSHLRNFPIDIVKIDRAFVRDIPGDKNDSELVSAIIAMAHNLNMNVVAEGVEDLAQVTFLRERGCDSVQGYFFSPPLSPEDMLVYLSDEPEKRTASDS